MTYHIHVHDKPDTKAFCGPTVLMLLTGKSREEVIASINREHNKQGGKIGRRIKRGYALVCNFRKCKTTDQVTGMSVDAMNRMLKKYKLNPEWVQKKQRPGMTLKTFADDMQFLAYPIVVALNDHYVLVYKGVVYDSRKRKGQAGGCHPYGNKHVEQYFVIQKRSPK